MPVNEISHRFQQAVIWQATGDIDNYGKIKVSTTPEEINVRWETVRRQITNEKGEGVSITVQLTLEEELPIGTAVWQGTIDTLPDTISDVYQIVGYDNVPDVKGRFFEIVAMLGVSSDSLPPQ